MTRAPRIALAILGALALAACSAGEPELSTRDADALATLADVAGPTSGVEPAAITATECWLPSDHLIDDETLNDTTWRVLCRTHYEDDGEERYQDATCVGDFAADPMLDHCYRWAYYTDMPHFEDEPGVRADRA